MWWEKDENKQKEAVIGPFFNIYAFFNLDLNCDEKRTRINKKRPRLAFQQDWSPWIKGQNRAKVCSESTKKATKSHKIERPFGKYKSSSIDMNTVNRFSPDEEVCPSERCSVPEMDFWKFRFRLSSRPHVATLMFIWSGLGIFPCWRKIFRWRRSFGLRVIRGFKNLIWKKCFQF